MTSFKGRVSSDKTTSSTDQRSLIIDLNSATANDQLTNVTHMPENCRLSIFSQCGHDLTVIGQRDVPNALIKTGSVMLENVPRFQGKN